MSFSQHYHEELAYMREKLRELVDKYPDMESILGEYGGDEGVERLLQSYAFLTARLRDKIDDDSPEVIHDVCRIMAPQLLRTFPACSILEYKPDFTTSKGRTRIQQGTEVKSRPIDGTECRFRTT